MLQQIGYNSAELAIEWLTTHPEQPGIAAAAPTDNAAKDDDEAVKKQLIASLGSDEVPKLEVSITAFSDSLCSLHHFLT